MSTIWLDALTPKQAQIFSAMARRLMGEGYDVILTLRDYDYTVSVAEQWGVKYSVVGGYGDTLEDKLREELKRALSLVELVSRHKPCAAIMYPSPSGARVAYGLSIPLIILSDSPHSVHPHRLTLPLASYLIHSSYIPANLFDEYILSKFTRRITFNGVDEAEYLRDYYPSRSLVEDVGLRPFEYVVIRPAEYKASYYVGLKAPRIEDLARHIADKGFTIVYLPRYPEQRSLGIQGEYVIIPDKALPGPDLVAYAALVVTGGASMAREAALLGTPAISLYPGNLPVDEALRSKGLPLWRTNSLQEAQRIVDMILEDPEKYRRGRELLDSMEKPSDVVTRIIREYC